MQSFDLPTKREPMYQGRLGRKKNTELGGALRRKYMFPLLTKNDINVSQAAGEESHLIARKLSEHPGWATAIRRFTANNGGAGLLYEARDGHDYNGKSILFMAWIPPKEQQSSHPRINVPSDIYTIDDMYELSKLLNLYYLVLYARLDGRITRYAFGQYSDIPKGTWWGWNKHGREKINSIRFKHQFTTHPIGIQGAKLATRIRQELHSR